MNSYNGFTAAQRMKALRWSRAEEAAGRRTGAGDRCDVCLQERGHLERHSEDYSEPFGDHIGRWTLCYRCHMILHCRFRNPDAFRHYCEVLKAGNRFELLYNRNFPAFLSQHAKICKAPIEAVGLVLPGFALLLEEGQRAADLQCALNLREVQQCRV